MTTLQSYAEKCGKIVTNWREVLTQLINNGESHSTPFLLDLRERSSKWDTCMVGIQPALIPRHGDDHNPVDKILDFVGREAHRHIYNKQWREALSCLDIVELRVKQLLGAQRVQLASDISETRKQLEEKENTLKLLLDNGF